MHGAADGLGRGDAGLAVDAEEADELGFEMEEGAEGGLAAVEVAQGAEEEVEEFRDGMLRLGDELDEFHEIGGELGAEEIGAQSIEGLGESHFAQRVEIAFAAGDEADLREEEEIELAGEGAAGAAGAFGDGLEAALGL